MATDLRRTRGAIGEEIAARHLTREGYELIDRNYRTRFGEIDLVAADVRCLVFCEVKTRVAHGRAGPARGLDAIGSRKRRQVRAMAGQWLHDRRGRRDTPRRPGLRFDAIGVTLSAGGELLSLEHVRDAF
jgi:putative endonuclease